MCACGNGLRSTFTFSRAETCAMERPIMDAGNLIAAKWLSQVQKTAHKHLEKRALLF